MKFRVMIHGLEENEINKYSVGCVATGACMVRGSLQVDAEAKHFTQVVITPGANFQLQTADGADLKGLAALFDAPVMRVGERLHVPTGVKVVQTEGGLVLRLQRDQSFDYLIKQLQLYFDIDKLQQVLDGYRKQIGKKACQSRLVNQDQDTAADPVDHLYSVGGCSQVIVNTDVASASTQVADGSGGAVTPAHTKAKCRLTTPPIRGSVYQRDVHSCPSKFSLDGEQENLPLRPVTA